MVFFYKDKFLFSSNEIKLKGFHNYLNILVVLNIINEMSISVGAATTCMHLAKNLGVNGISGMEFYRNSRNIRGSY